jgi:hypothetical protein
MRWKTRLLLILPALLFLCVPRVAAFDWDPVTDADKAMKSNPMDPGAGAVVLFKRGEIDVLERTSLAWTTHVQTYTRIKVFTDAGREAADVKIEAPKWMRLLKIEGRTILPSGEVIPLDSSKVFRGTAYQVGKSFAMLQTSFTFPSVAPGSIIEYQTEEIADWFYLPPWIFDTRGIGTLQSSLRVLIGPRLGMSTFPLDNNLSKLSVASRETVQGTQFDFATQNLHPIVDEPYALPFRDQAVMVMFTPTELVFSDNVYPLIKTWDDVAKEFARELVETDKNDKETKNKSKELTEKISDPRQKAQAIYKYLQQNFTSSNLMGVGLGRPADEIVSAKRGDPDEINALFIIMLKEAKIDADMVLLATKNWESLVGSFPNMRQFSRMITRIDFKDGAVFTDPADAAAPFGELPWFDRGVTGLAVKGTKIQQAPIPDGSIDDNLSVSKTTVQLGKDWSVEGDTEFDLKGAEAIAFRDDLLQEAPEKLENRLTDYFSYGLSDAEVSQLQHPEFRDSAQPFVLKAHFRERLTNDLSTNGLLLNPWLNDQYNRPLFKATQRHSAVRFENPEKRVSTSIWQVPPEIKIEQLPKDVKIENDLGGFSHSCTQSNNTVTCTRTYYLKKMILQTNVEYLNARKFFDEIAKNDQEVIVLSGH